jgi:ATP-dependent Lon protease
LTPEHLRLSEDGLDHLVNAYTREAGVRSLERRIGSMCRAVAVRLAEGDSDVSVIAGEKEVEELLGPPRNNRQEAERVPSVGVCTNLAWTPAGGELMLIEAYQMPGKGRTNLTGHMGNIMKESFAAAFTYIRARASQLALADDFLTKIDIHLHLPEGAIPKDGPSAGVGMFVALASMLTKLKVRTDVAVTGEITLRGNILRVGAIKDKCMAAHRFGIQHVIMPKANEPDLEEIPKEIREGITIHLVSRLEEVLALALLTEDLGSTPSASTAAAPAP